MSKPELDIVVIGHRPGPETGRVLRDAIELCGRHARLLYFDNTGNPKNLSQAWNDMAMTGDASIIVFLNSDTVPSRGWGVRLSRVLDQNPFVGAAIPWPMYASQVHFLGRTFCLGYPPSREALDELVDLADELHPADDPIKAGMCMPFFAVAIRRCDFVELKGFDERLRFYGQDHDFQERLAIFKKQTVWVKSCPFHPGASVSTQRAISRRDINIESEYKHSDKLLPLLRAGKMLRWHLLSDEERRAVRNDLQYQISKGK